MSFRQRHLLFHTNYLMLYILLCRQLSQLISLQLRKQHRIRAALHLTLELRTSYLKLCIPL